MKFFFSHGRTAFKYGLIYLDIKKNDKIMLPEYICDVLLDPLNDLGIKPLFYKINKDFTINWKSLKKKYNNSVKSLVVINYFGFEEDKKKIKLFCKKKKLFLIEDDCHSLNVNKNKINQNADIVFSSFRKILKKTYYGGILTISNNIDKQFFNKYKLKKKDINLKMIINNFLENNFLIFKRYLKSIIYKMPNYNTLNAIKNEKILKDCIVDDFSKLIYSKENFSKIKNIRLKNYRTWDNFCKKSKYFETIGRKLNKDKIPWLYPVYINNTKIRNKLFEFGWKNGYSVTSWPSLPKSQINKRNKKKWNNLVCFNTDRSINISGIEINSLLQNK